MQTDLELTRACAEAMGYEFSILNAAHPDEPEHLCLQAKTGWCYETYVPLTDDAQAFALVKRFGIDLVKAAGNGTWTGSIWNNDTEEFIDVTDADLNRAICECVARMKGAK